MVIKDYVFKFSSDRGYTAVVPFSKVLVVNILQEKPLIYNIVYGSQEYEFVKSNAAEEPEAQLGAWYQYLRAIR